jgi:hypothetical protein
MVEGGKDSLKSMAVALVNIIKKKSLELTQGFPFCFTPL